MLTLKSKEEGIWFEGPEGTRLKIRRMTTLTAAFLVGVTGRNFAALSYAGFAYCLEEWEGISFEKEGSLPSRGDQLKAIFNYEPLRDFVFRIALPKDSQENLLVS